MNIAYLSSATIPSRIASSMQVMSMCRAFSNNGHTVTLYGMKRGLNAACPSVFDYYGMEPVFNVKLFWAPAIRGIGGIIYAIQVWKHLKQIKDKPDIIYGRNIYSMMSATILDIPLYYEVHDRPKNALRRRLEKEIFAYRKFRRLICISEPLRSEYCSIHGRELHGKNILVAQDAADIPSDKNVIDESFFTGRKGVLRVGYAGSLYLGRGIDVIAALAGMFPFIDFHVLGGTENDLNFWRAKRTGANLHFHGFVKPAEVPTYLNAFDILLAPYQESVPTVKWMSPLKIFEYMARGKAIIASRLPALEEVLEDGRNALLANSQSLDEWARALKRLEEDKTLRERLASQAYQDCVAKYTWQKRAENVVSNSQEHYF